MFARYSVGGRLDPPYHPTKPSPYFIGRLLELPATAEVSRVAKDTFHMSHDLEFFAISVKTDSLNFEDYWNLTVDGKVIAKNIHCLNYEEGLYFQVAHPVGAGEVFEFEFHTADDKEKNIDIAFHFLTDPDTYPTLTSTNDLGNSNDPPPQTPESQLPPEHPPVGGILLPVSWTPFKAVSTAEKWCDDMGIAVSFDKNLDAANYVTEAIAHLLNTCGGFADMVQKHRLIITVKGGGGANGYFNPPTNEVVISNTYDFNNAAKIAKAEYDAHQKSTPNKLRTIIHEIGHWLHFHNVGEAMFYKYADLDSDAYGAQTILPQQDATYIANNLGNYATKWFPIELMPEVFAAKITGVPIDRKIWEWYEMYGGFKCSGW